MNTKVRTIETDRFLAFMRKWMWVFEILVLLTALLISLVRRHTDIDFIPINGTYQNYNPIRRLLSGQIPMRDFQDYLGMGHLYLGAFMTALFGGNYYASLYAFDLLAMLSTLLIFLTIGYCVLRDRTTIATAVLSVHTDKTINGVADVWIDYRILEDEKSDWRRLVMLEPMLRVKNGSYETELEQWYGSFNLRSQSAEYIPILIQDGYGEVTLSAEPCDNVLLKVLDVRCDRVFADLTANDQTASAD